MKALRLLAGLVAILAALLFTGCGGKKVRTAKPPRIGATEKGIASWYGPPYHGRRAANGEIYDMEKLTAAHRTLPFNTWIRVKNMSNQREVDVRIQDRGPFIHGRVIDLSKAAAREIEMLGPGITEVRLTVIAAPKDLASDPELFAVQVGAFRDEAKAEALREEMTRRYPPVQVIRRAGDPPVWRVLAGQEGTIGGAERIAAEVRSSGGEAFVVRLDPIKP